ncbi:MAG: 2-C-methyl-D-erythritol 2,4-cyclodiphosphate synthase [Propionibacteriaceae bacterium]|nr:2-C-methyl-D-erythritol 2,4-cyclodiphosphate synthase [Propionibacteriaceae bacterium]
MRIRTGVGVDAHQLVESREMYLAGLFFADEKYGPAGHSDGDVACHAICDALLSASSLGDLGEIFGTDDPTWSGASGVALVGHVVELVHDAGFEIGNVAVQVLGNSPKLAPRRREAEEALTQVVGAPVSVAATSTDGLGFTGRGEGIMAVASALVFSD